MKLLRILKPLAGCCLPIKTGIPSCLTRGPSLLSALPKWTILPVWNIAHTGHCPSELKFPWGQQFGRTLAANGINPYFFTAIASHRGGATHISVWPFFGAPNLTVTKPNSSGHKLSLVRFGFFCFLFFEILAITRTVGIKYAGVPEGTALGSSEFKDPRS